MISRSTSASSSSFLGNNIKTGFIAKLPVLAVARRGYMGNSSSTPKPGGYYYPDGVGADSRWADGHSGYQWKQRSLDEARGMAIDYMTNVSKRTPIHDGVRMKAKQSQAALYVDKHKYKAQRADRYGNYVVEKESPAGIIQEASRLSATAMATDVEELLDDDDDFDYDDATKRLSSSSSSTQKKKKDFTIAGVNFKDEDFGSMMTTKKKNNETKSAEDNQKEGNNDRDDDDDEDDLEMMDENEFSEILNSLRNIPREDLQMLGQEMYGEASTAADEARDKMLENWFKLRSKRAPHTIFAAGLEEERNLWTPWYLKHEGRN